jgi:hypothetical protein
MHEPITPGLPQLYSDGECRRMPPGRWLIHGLKAKPEGGDEVITVTVRRCDSRNVIWVVALQGRGPEMRHSFDIPIWSRGGGVEVVVEGGAAWVEVVGEPTEGCLPNANAADAAGRR